MGGMSLICSGGSRLPKCCHYRQWAAKRSTAQKIHSNHQERQSPHNVVFLCGGVPFGRVRLAWNSCFRRCFCFVEKIRTGISTDLIDSALFAVTKTYCLPQNRLFANLNMKFVP